MAGDEIWNTFLADFNKKSIEMMEYSNSISHELDMIEAELDIDRPEESLSCVILSDAAILFW